MSRTERGWEAAGFGHYSLPDEQNQQEQMRILEEEHGGLCTALLGICLSLLHLLWEMLLHGIRSLRTMD